MAHLLQLWEGLSPDAFRRRNLVDDVRNTFGKCGGLVDLYKHSMQLVNDYVTVET